MSESHTKVGVGGGRGCGRENEEQGQGQGPGGVIQWDNYLSEEEEEEDDNQDPNNWSNVPKPPFFFQRLESDEVVYKLKKKKCKYIGDSEYVMGELLGEGSYGKVKECLHSKTLERRAVKILKRRKLRRIPNGEANVEREIKLMRRLSHANVIKLIDVMFNEEKQKMYIVLEYCLAGLQDLLLIAKDNRFPEWQGHRYFTQLIAGLEYLHSQGIIHKDIKPGNLLLTLQETIKITDFGVAELLDPYCFDDTCHTSQGSPVFQPPEVANGESFSGSKLDVWSSGVTLYNMTTGKYPFDGDTVFLLFENIARGEFIIPQGIDESLSSLIRGMLHVDQEYRFSIQNVKQHPWFRRPQLSQRRFLSNPWPEDMVRLPPERRKISILPYIINTYNEDNQTDQSLSFNEDEERDNFFANENYFIDDDEVAAYYGNEGRINYQVVIGEEISGERSHMCGPSSSTTTQNNHNTTSNKQVRVQRHNWFRSIRKSFPKMNFCRQS